LCREVNARVFVDRSNTDQAREGLRGLEEKRQHLKDQERDSNRDIYQLAKEYKRKVEEFN
jgi:hypothetical protein